METPEANAEKTTPTFDIEAYMSSKAEAVKEALHVAVPGQDPKDSEDFHEAVRLALLGNKTMPFRAGWRALVDNTRLHSIVSIAACELFGGEQETVMPIACAMEMLNDWSLAHDTFMNSVADSWEDARRQIQVEEATELLVGDALICKAFEHIAKETKGVSAENVVLVLARVGRSVGSEGVVAGQIVDQPSSDGMDLVNLQVVEFIHLNKTAISGGVLDCLRCDCGRCIR